MTLVVDRAYSDEARIERWRDACLGDVDLIDLDNRPHAVAVAAVLGGTST